MLKQITTGACISVNGELTESIGACQAAEVQARGIEVLGLSLRHIFSSSLTVRIKAGTVRTVSVIVIAIIGRTVTVVITASEIRNRQDCVRIGCAAYTSPNLSNIEESSVKSLYVKLPFSALCISKLLLST